MYVAIDYNGADARETFHCIFHIYIYIFNCLIADFKIKFVYFKRQIDYHMIQQFHI